MINTSLQIMIEKQLTIIIPTKNEAKNLTFLFNSLLSQSFDLTKVDIIIADSSTDQTPDVINEYIKRGLNIKLISGGLPSIARNNGAKFATTKYILFIDADIKFLTNTIIENSIKKAQKDQSLMLTCNYRCLENKIADFFYRLTNIATRMSKFDQSFATTMFLLFDREYFNKLDGFDEKAKHCEDVLLSKLVPTNKFSIINEGINTDDRRFKKEGYFGFVKMFVKNWINRNNTEYFYKDIGYWN